MHPPIVASCVVLAMTLGSLAVESSQTRPHPERNEPVGGLLLHVSEADPLLAVPTVVLNTSTETIYVARRRGEFEYAGAGLYTSSGELLRHKISRLQAEPTDDIIVELKPGDMVVGNVRVLRDYVNVKPGYYYAVMAISLFRKDGNVWSRSGNVSLGTVGFELEEGEGRHVEVPDAPATRRAVSATTSAPARE